jgi:uncharacterized repeat protein (TIGR01451 family)
MVGTINKDYGAAVADAKTSFDFTLNSSLLSAVLASAMVVAGLYSNIWGDSWPVLVRSGLGVFVLAGTSYAMYLSTIARAIDWGDMYKGAFDLYRGDLLKQLGYEQVPRSMEEERILWEPISRQMVERDLLADNSQSVPYTFTSTTAYGEPHHIRLDVVRGVASVADNGSVDVVVDVRNPTPRTVKNVSITELLPDGFDYVWDSASVGGNTAPVTGSNPYIFKAGDLEGTTNRILTYRIIPNAQADQAL